MVDPTLFRPLLNQSQLSHLQYEVSVEQELKLIGRCPLDLRKGDICVSFDATTGGAESVQQVILFAPFQPSEFTISSIASRY